MNRKKRKQELQKIAQEQKSQAIIQKEIDALNTSDINEIGGESPEAFAERVTLELISAMPPIAGLEED